jgi:hypothetical protein
MMTRIPCVLSVLVLSSQAFADDTQPPQPAPLPAATQPAPQPAPPQPAPAAQASASLHEQALPKVNMAASVGMNSPMGMFGLEADYRLHRYFSAGLAGGYGLWGIRISPTAKLEIPIRSSMGIFLEGAVSVNTGGKGYTEENGMRQDFKMGVVPAASINFGGRVKRWGPFWTGARVGVSFALRKEAYTIVGTEPMTDLTKTALDLAYPGGLVVAWMAGAAF